MMTNANLDHDTCYNALISRDQRFDGCFFVGVTSTGVYCRPVCAVRKPKKENTLFFRSAAAAENGGFRPCLKCRPELAPGLAAVDSKRQLARAASNLIEQGFLRGRSLAQLAARIGVSDRYLRDLFQNEFGVSPIQYSQTHRLLLAKQLLTESDLSMTDVALAAGFNSTRRFNDLFQKHYSLIPSKVRRRSAPSQTDMISFEMPYRPPYAWDALLNFLNARTIAGVDAVVDGRYRRIVRVEAEENPVVGWFEASHEAEAARIRIRLDSTLSRHIGYLINRLRAFFDVSCVPQEINKVLGTLAQGDPGLRIPGGMDGFEIAVRAILGQQITVAAARTLLARLVDKFGEPIDTPFPEIHRAFPNAATLVDLPIEELASLGVIRTRVRAIQEIAAAMLRGELTLTPATNVEQEIKRLHAIPGIGDWTAQYIALRAMSWPDGFPASDVGVRKALGGVDAKQAALTAEDWRPWRGYAVMHLWRSLEISHD
ncbi:AlkA N-terminal domain-containing protein [Hahella aquimaris]|uniref:DNA-3-methyladenine glycosylase 2 family protein n=1 Tax=Hahella sp. HNIBRBA332 TaxID=3015983 RepID=UPI00273AB895|nr:DNA-3-methyladenine glycosylase 2 family protein [Hahella sp. HNIBRBA332]WLQ15172.1 AlkA N-terminal domain-containing protein [Hahella sp. HNIBRBA332]